MPSSASSHPRVAVIGGGPAGLMAAEVLVAAGLGVDLYDGMLSAGRKFLMAGRGGLNLTHAEAAPDFLSRYGARQARIAPWLDSFGPAALRDWAMGLGTETFIGSSGRVFPVGMKAAPLLRAWLHRLRQAGVRFHMRHRWLGWEDGRPCFDTPQGRRCVQADALVLALGGASWRKLGSDGAWTSLLAARGVDIAPLMPANCGFDVAWSEHFRQRFAGEPVKSVAAGFTDHAGIQHRRVGEFVVSATGVEGSLIYALSAPLRDSLTASGPVTLSLDLAPDKSPERVEAEITHPRGSRSLSSHLQSRVGITGVKAGLLRECLGREDYGDPLRLAQAIKALPLVLRGTRPMDEAISTAGGVRFEDMDADLMLKALPGVFCAGEMLDWEAPTGGYLLTACFASGRVAAAGVIDYLRRPAPEREAPWTTD
ncbi:TIGR03862 family flavoprotein [Denitratisoma oestradiolicum]|uniref:Predicted flavoprotein n=1 Tax=Denitratisoma oestradiolicum TaxID=311182 RepID=A0A6S6Y715_9PROT|nr:TIGR03862 family flavoprotein [Denitratisoma oestradiolicum]TWO79253.1 aminoacetone oxidase family FAD-binding enzyme [Denitratisoma oestradiolicum]CAB1368258.1 Predicted flavoprotein [Denitratisoma oestradiolicum]